MDVGHAPLAPSAGFQWRYCAGGVIMRAMAGSLANTDAAVEGDAAHWAASEGLHGVELDSLLGQPAPNGHVITKQILRYVTEYIAIIRGYLDRYPDAEIFIEHTVSISCVHPDCWGTFDCGIYVPSLKLLIITDFKYGYGIIDIHDNPQINLYTLGFLEELITQRSRPVDTIKIGVIQPRAYHPEGISRFTDITKAELSVFREEIKIAAAKAVQPGADCQTGSHCKNCEARAICPAIRAATDNALDFIEQAQPEQLNGHDLGLYLFVLKTAQGLFNARLESLEAQAEDMIQKGQPVLGHGIGPGRGSRDWNRPDEEIKALGDMADIKLSKEVLLSPNQAETAGLDKRIVAAYITKTPGKPKLQTGDPSELAERIFRQ